MKKRKLLFCAATGGRQNVKWAMKTKRNKEITILSFLCVKVLMNRFNSLPHQTFLSPYECWLLPHDSPEETSEVPTGRSVFPATAGPILCSGFPWKSEGHAI